MIIVVAVLFLVSAVFSGYLFGAIKGTQYPRERKVSKFEDYVFAVLVFVVSVMSFVFILGQAIANNANV